MRIDRRHNTPPAVAIIAGVLVATAAGVPGARGQITANPPEAMPEDPLAQPTQYGVRGTPPIMKALAGIMVKEETGDLGLSKRQRGEVQEVVFEHMMRTSRSDGDHWQGLFEKMILWDVNRNESTPDVEAGQALARNYLDLVDPIHRMLDGIEADLQPILNSDQHELLQYKLRKIRSEVESQTERMRKWADGKVEGRPFDGQTPEPALSEEEEARLQVLRKRLKARSRAENEVLDLSTDGWPAFVERTGEFYGFTDDQKQRAADILADYRQQVDAIMTPQWWEQVRMLRTKRHLLAEAQQQDKEPTAPWLFQIDLQYWELIDPVRDLGDEFHRAVLALASDGQRATAAAKLEQAAVDHGVQGADLDALRALVYKR